MEIQPKTSYLVICICLSLLKIDLVYQFGTVPKRTILSFVFWSSTKQMKLHPQDNTESEISPSNMQFFFFHSLYILSLCLIIPWFIVHPSI